MKTATEKPPASISVIIPVYNVESYLRQCLDSVVDQTFPSLEIICVNDGSTDGSLSVLNEYASRDGRIVVLDKLNGGLSSARNAGLNAARGKYVLFLDSDDFIDLELCARAYEKAEALQAELIFFNVASFTKECVFADCFFRYPDVNGVFRPVDKPLFLMQVSAWNRLYRRDMIGDVRFVEGLYFEDNPFSAEINLRAQRAGLINQALYFYRRDSQASITSDERKAAGIFATFDEVKKVIGRYGADGKPYASAWAASELVNYKNRFNALPAARRGEFVAAARSGLRGADWASMLEDAREYDHKFWPWSRADERLIRCLRWSGFS